MKEFNKIINPIFATIHLPLDFSIFKISSHLIHLAIVVYSPWILCLIFKWQYLLYIFVCRVVKHGITSSTAIVIHIPWVWRYSDICVLYQTTLSSSLLIFKAFKPSPPPTFLRVKDRAIKIYLASKSVCYWVASSAM